MIPQIWTDIVMERVRLGLSADLREKFDLYDLELVWLPFELSEKEEEMAGFGGILPFGKITANGVVPVVPAEAINWKGILLWAQARKCQEIHAR